MKRHRPKRVPAQPHVRAARIGAKLRASTEDSLEFVFDCLASRMRRSEILRAYAMAVESRAKGIAEWEAKEPEARKGLRPVPLRPLKSAALDDLIRSAKDRMIASVRPDKAEEARAELVTYLRRMQKRMATDDTATAGGVGVQAAMAEAKLTGLIVDKVEAKNENRYPQLGDAERGALARFLESVPGAPRSAGG